MELTQTQIQDLYNLKRWCPYRIVYGAINNNGDFVSGAVYDMRQPNKLIKQGYTVFKI